MKKILSKKIKKLLWIFLSIGVILNQIDLVAVDKKEERKYIEKEGGKAYDRLVVNYLTITLINKTKYSLSLSTYCEGIPRGSMGCSERFDPLPSEWVLAGQTLSGKHEISAPAGPSRIYYEYPPHVNRPFPYISFELKGKNESYKNLSGSSGIYGHGKFNVDVKAEPVYMFYPDIGGGEWLYPFYNYTITVTQ